MKQSLVKPGKKLELSQKVFLLNSPKPTNENCDCQCGINLICK